MGELGGVGGKEEKGGVNIDPSPLTMPATLPLPVNTGVVPVLARRFSFLSIARCSFVFPGV